MTGEVIKVITAIDFPRYLVVGQRIDLAEGVDFDATSNHWKVDLLALFDKNGAQLHGPTAMDYFIFPRGMWQDLPTLVIGRGGYDGALVASCLRNKIPIINATLEVPALHQFHDYAHLPGGKNAVYEGSEAKNNLILHNIKHSIPNSADAQWLILDGVVIPNSIQKDWIRNIELTLRFDFGLGNLSLVVRLFWRIAMAIGILTPKGFTIQDVFFSSRRFLK